MQKYSTSKLPNFEDHTTDGRRCLMTPHRSGLLRIRTLHVDQSINRERRIYDFFVKPVITRIKIIIFIHKLKNEIEFTTIFFYDATILSIIESL